MREITAIIVTLGITAAGCSADPAAPTVEESGSVHFPLSSLPRLESDEGAAPCDEPGVFVDADGRVVACFSGGVRVAVGDITNDGHQEEVELTIRSEGGQPLPPTHVIPEDGRASVGDRSVDVAAATSIAVVTDDQEVPNRVDAPEDCEGVTIDTETGDILICTQAIGLLLPAVQRVRPAEPEPVALLLPAVQKVREAASHTQAGLLLPAVQNVQAAAEQARPGLLLPAVQKAHEGTSQAAGTHAGGGGGGAGKVQMALVMFGIDGQDVSLSLQVEGRGQAEATSDGLGVFVGTTALAGRGKADIIIE